MSIKCILLLLGLLLTACTTVEPTTSSTIENYSETERVLGDGSLEIGNPDAPHTLQIYTEHHCGYCKEFFRDHLPKLQSEFIKDGSLKLQITIFPLEKYVGSELAAIGMYCAGLEGAGLKMHDLLFKIGAKDKDVLLKQARTLELNEEMFTACINDLKWPQAIVLDKERAEKKGVRYVPTFFLDDEISEGLPYYPDLRGMIEDVMSDE